MTLTLNDTIELLKAILEECGVDCIVLIISSVVANGTILIPSFNTIKTHGIRKRLRVYTLHNSKKAVTAD